MKPNRPPNPRNDGHPASSTNTDRPSSPWQLFGARVRQIRDEAGMTTDDLTRTEVCPTAHLANIESGTVTPMRATAEYLDNHLNAHGRLLDAWARARISDHLNSNADIHPLQLDAARIREFQPGSIPAFFHTDGYATALADAANPLRERNSGVEIQRLRRGRYSIHSGTGAPVSLILDEAVVRAVVGSAAIMREQLTHLLAFISRGKVQVQIIPRDTDAHPCPGSGFRILTLSAHHTLAYIPAPCTDGQLITDGPKVQAISELFDTLTAAALPPGVSTNLIRGIIAELPRHEPRALTPGTADTSPTSTRRPAVPTTV